MMVKHVGVGIWFAMPGLVGGQRIMLFDKQAKLERVTALTLRLSLRICGMAIQILATV